MTSRKKCKKSIIAISQSFFLATSESSNCYVSVLTYTSSFDMCYIDRRHFQCSGCQSLIEILYYAVRCEKAEQNRPCSGEIITSVYKAQPTICPTCRKDDSEQKKETEKK